MKKNRNTFFQESQVFSGTGFPNPNINNTTQPFTTASYQSSNFYAGPGNNQMPLNYNIPPNQFANNNTDYSDIESRLSKIERTLNRLDARIGKLENTTLYSNDDIETTNNIYMI